MKRAARRAVLGALLTLATGMLPAAAQTAASPWAADLRETVVRVPAEVDDAKARRVAGELVVTMFRPPGPGKFPLVVINHGRGAEAAVTGRPRFESAARYFVRKGFAVAVPLRLGYGELASLGDPESIVDCLDPAYERAVTAGALQIADVVRALVKRADIDADRVVLVGQSAGGLMSLAATAESLPGLVAAISFAGGHGANPSLRPGEPCHAERLTSLFGRIGSTVPTLWIHAANDRYFSARRQREWAQAYRTGGGSVQLVELPDFGEDGHRLFSQGNDRWQPIVDEFLRPLGFDIPGALPFPADGRVRVDDEDRLPGAGAPLVRAYRHFLDAPAPRAFALNGRGHWGFAQGDDAQSRALAACDAAAVSDEPCRLYAVNSTVVWSHP